MLSYSLDNDSLACIDASNASKGNKRALTALQNNVSGLCFSNPNNLEKLLKGIQIEHIRIDFKNYTNDFPAKWKGFIKGRNATGAFHGLTKNKTPDFMNTIFAKGSTAKEQIDSAFQQGIKNPTNIQFHFEIGSNYFLEIAKIKAFRILWESKKGDPPFIFATTTLANKEEKFAYNNILRTTTECMSSIFGGANAIMINSYNHTFEMVLDGSVHSFPPVCSPIG